MENQSFSEMIQGKAPILVNFSAEWCGPCKMMKPILEELNKEMGDRVKIIKVDVDKNPEAARSFKISGVPTLMLFRNGKQEWRQSGVVPADHLKRILTEAF